MKTKFKLENIIKTNFDKFDLFNNIIILGYMGSTAHGTQVIQEGIIPDKDIYGIAISPADYYLGMKKFEQFEM